MRKIALLLVLFILVILSVACNKKKNNNVIIKEGKGNLIIEYTSSVQELANSTYYIKIYDNKKIRYGWEEKKKIKLKLLKIKSIKILLI